MSIYMVQLVSMLADKDFNLKALMLPIFLYGCEAWTLNGGLIGVSVPLIPCAFTGSRGITGMTLCSLSYCMAVRYGH